MSQMTTATAIAPPMAMPIIAPFDSPLPLKDVPPSPPDGGMLTVCDAALVFADDSDVELLGGLGIESSSTICVTAIKLSDIACPVTVTRKLLFFEVVCTILSIMALPAESNLYFKSYVSAPFTFCCRMM
jgi:hypothetical protein